MVELHGRMFEACQKAYIFLQMFVVIKSRSNKCIKFTLGISIYKTLEQFYYTPAHFTHFILVKFLKKSLERLTFSHTQKSRVMYPARPPAVPRDICGISIAEMKRNRKCL